MPKAAAKTYPHDLFLTKDAEGRVHWFLGDPKKNSSIENETDIAESIFAFVGQGDILNPVMVRFQCAHIERCWPFEPKWPEMIRRFGKRHIEDRAGAFVEIIDATNKTDFPFNGAVLADDGTVACVRTYNEHGDCSDGIAEHGILVMANADNEDAEAEEK